MNHNETRNEKRRLKRTDRDRMTDRNSELVPDSWSLVREKEKARRPLDFVRKDGFLSDTRQILAVHTSLSTVPWPRYIP